MKTAHIFLFMLSAPWFASADNLQWGNTHVNAWSGFGTSPYTATDTSQNIALTIFCLDFNDEIAPPIDWRASIVPLTAQNVSQYAQFGGNYNAELAAAAGPGQTVPTVTGAPFAFTGPLSGASANPYIRYLEAAWLFSNIQHALAAGDRQSDTIFQVAAWDLFVEQQNLAALTSDVTGTPGSWTFTNYLNSADGYSTITTTPPIPGLSFQNAVNHALAAAEAAVSQQNWAGSAFFGTWSIVTGEPGWTDTFGRPVQEFLTPTPVIDPPPPASVPEPAGVILFGTLVAGIAISYRRRDRSARPRRY